MLKRRTPLKPGKGFQRRRPGPAAEVERAPRELPRLYRPCPQAVITQVARPVPKENPARSEKYLRLVASLPCIMCKRVGFSQAAHCDMGKGASIKADDRQTFPACATRPGAPGCHDIIGASGAYTKEERRALEARNAALTRAEIRRRGLWPPELEPWPGDELLAA